MFIRPSRSTGSTTTNAASVTVTNDAHQSITIRQNSLHGNNAVQGAVPSGKSYDCGADTSPMTQDESLNSFVTGKGSITQKQDTATTGSANVVVDIEQNQGSGFKCATATVCPSSGTNNAAFEQSTDMEAVANTPKGPVVQTQSASVPNPPYSGIVGTINQDSQNTSTAHATQKETQCEDAVNVHTIPTLCDTDHSDVVPTYSITQTQYGPLGVFTPPTPSQGRVHAVHKGYGQSGQTGNTGDLFFLTQNSQQDTDGGPHSTQNNSIVGDCTSGTVVGCQAGQTATLNGLGINDGYTSPTITGLTINCSTNNGNCTATPPPVPTITSSAPPSQTESRSVSFTFNDAPATAGFTFECSITGLGGFGFTTCVSGQTFSGLGTGPHTFKVRAVDTTASTNRSLPTSSSSWTIVDAKISIASSATNEVGQSHTFTVTLLKDTGAGAGLTTPAAGETVTTSIVNSLGATSSMTGGTCGAASGTSGSGTTNASGQCTIVINGPTTGTVKAFASVGVHFPNSLRGQTGTVTRRRRRSGMVLAARMRRPRPGSTRISRSRRSRRRMRLGGRIRSR